MTTQMIKIKQNKKYAEHEYLKKYRRRGQTSTTKKFSKHNFSAPTLLLGFHSVSIAPFFSCNFVF